MDDQFQPYVNRVLGSTRSETYRLQLASVHPSPKFQRGVDRWDAVPFPGYTIIAPPRGEDPVNQRFYNSLQDPLAALLAELPPDFLVSLPPESLHITLADLVWADVYQQVSQLPDFTVRFSEAIARIFQSYPGQTGVPIAFQTVGLMVMPRALGITLVPATEGDYNRILDLRRAIYQEPDLLGMGVEQHYNFTAHITLGYFGEIPTEMDWNTLSDRFVEMNQKYLVSLPEFVVERAELRKFEDMTRYEREPNWPILMF